MFLGTLAASILGREGRKRSIRAGRGLITAGEKF